MAKIDYINTLLARTTMLHSLVLDVDKKIGSYDLIISMSKNEDSAEVSTIHFKNIANLRVEADAAGWIQLMMLRVLPNEPGHERIFKVVEKEHSIISFTCASIEIV